MTSLDELRRLLDLKDVYRDSHGDRTDSSAEHTWGCMILAEHFFRLEEGLDELRVLKLLLYHDVVEAEAGDTSIVDVKAREGQTEREAEAAERLRSALPQTLGEEYHAFFMEFEAQETRESRFAKAIDKLEPMLYWIDRLDDWQAYGIDEAFWDAHKRPHFIGFPSVQAVAEAIIERFNAHP